MVSNEIKISVIIPIYNAEKYLDQCITSVCDQQHNNLEIILVNDGSIDHSDDICIKYEKSDERIIYVKQDNRGLVNARKTGVSHAKGDYVTFVDADDWIDDDFYERMLSQFNGNDIDIVTSGMIWEFADGSTFLQRDCFDSGLYCEEDIRNKIIPNMLYSMKGGRQGITAAVCNKLFKPELLRRSQSELKTDNLRIGEDAAVVYPAILNAKNMIVTDICAYHYRQHGASILHGMSGASFDELIQLSEILYDAFYTKGFETEYKNQSGHFLFGYLGSMLRSIYGVAANDYTFFPPISSLKKGCRIAIYGAGVMGRDYYRRLCSDKDYKLVGWFDRNYDNLGLGSMVNDPKGIPECVFDYILIAIADADVASEIQNDMVSMGIEAKKIIHAPITI